MSGPEGSDGAAIAGPVRTVRSDDLDIAYQVVGHGDRDLVVLLGWTSHLDLMWELPELAGWIEGLAGLGRVILHDKRGVGLSDRPSRPPEVDEMVRDTLAVMDAVGSRVATVIGWVESAAVALTLAARHPDRVESLVLGEAIACARPDPEHPFGYDPKAIEDIAATLESGAWGTGASLAVVAPSAAGDARVARWWQRWERGSASASMAANLLRTNLDLDVRPHLGDVGAPTLLLRRERSPLVSREASRWLADHLADARLVELPGQDVAAYTQHADEVLDEIEEFLTGARSGGGRYEVVTLMFTDLVGSTDAVAELRDRRWSSVLASHQAEVRRVLTRFHGTEIDTAGDGFLATFSLPSQALRAAMAIRDASGGVGAPVRVGLHAGEIVRAGARVTGLAVHLGARVMSAAEAGEVVASRTVRDLTIGADVGWTSLGERTLKGVPGTWELLRLDRVG